MGAYIGANLKDAIPLLCGLMLILVTASLLALVNGREALVLADVSLDDFALPSIGDANTDPTAQQPQPLMALVWAAMPVILVVGILGTMAAERALSQLFAHLLPRLRKAQRGFRITPARNQDVEYDAVLVDGAPQPARCPGDLNDDLIEVPLVAGSRQAPPDLVRELLTKLQRSLPHRLVADDNAASGQHLLDHAQAQRKAEREPDRGSSRVNSGGLMSDGGRLDDD